MRSLLIVSAASCATLMSALLILLVSSCVTDDPGAADEVDGSADGSGSTDGSSTNNSDDDQSSPDADAGEGGALTDAPCIPPPSAKGVRCGDTVCSNGTPCCAQKDGGVYCGTNNDPPCIGSDVRVIKCLSSVTCPRTDVCCMYPQPVPSLNTTLCPTPNVTVETAECSQAGCAAGQLRLCEDDTARGGRAGCDAGTHCHPIKMTPLATSAVIPAGVCVPD